jgi:Carboxypeptidase regulatory-like domain/TonB-dependent Receptor Plug Domain
MSINKLNRLHLIMCGLVCTLITFNYSFAQTVTGTITGTVTDARGNVISGAKVTVTDERTGSVRTATTNDEGDFNFAAMQPAIYTIRIEVRDFRSLERKNTVLSANEHLALGKLTMEIGQVSEVVTTVAEGAVVESQSSDLTARLTADQISLISTKGRDVTSLLRLLPGVSYVDDVESVGEGFGTDLPNVSGQRGRSNIASVNGLMGNDISGSNKLSMTINQDAVEEVKVLRNNYAAEYGNQGGAHINIVTKSGKKDYNGTGYYFLRNEALNANDFFNNRVGLPRGLYRHNIWGFNFGGPVRVPWLYPNKERKNLFFFYSLERPHTITPQSAKFVTVPTELERRGDFSQSIRGISSNGQPIKAFVRDPLLPGNCSAADQTACFRDPSRATPDNPQGLNIIPLSRVNPSGAAILNFFPLPNVVGGRTLGGDSYNYVVQRSVDVPKLSQVIRIDFKPTEKNSFYVNASTWTSDNEGFDTSGWPGGGNNRWGISSHYLYQDDGLVFNWVRIFSPTIVNEVSVGLRHGSEGFIPSDGEVERLSRTTQNYIAPQLFPGNNRLGTIPRATSWGGLSQTSVANINWLDRWGEVGEDYVLPSISNNLTINRGSHNYKMGVYLERLRNGEARGGNWSGTFNFSSNDGNFTAALGNTGHPYANAFTGSFRSYSESSSRPHTDLERTLVQWYVQDQWKVNSRLSLNYGLRMGWFSQWRQRLDDAANFDPTRFDPANAPVLYRPFCTSGMPAFGTSCPNDNRRAINPLTGEVFKNLALVGTFVPGTGDMLNGIVMATDPAIPRGLKDPAPIQWEPRIGFAWSLFESGKTVLRTNVGVYHSSRVGGGTTGGNLVGNPPFQRNVTIDFGNIDNLANLLGTALQRTSGLNAVEVHAKTPTIYNFTLGIQQDIGLKSILEISYVGSLARHLGERRNINAVPDGARFLDLHPENRNPFSETGALGNEFLRPYQGYGDINMVMYSGTSNYNGLQVQLSRRYTSTFQFGIAYTWAKTFDYANDDSSDVFFPRPYRDFNYGPADHDQNHIFTVNYIWDLPRLSRVWDNRLIRGIFNNWQLSGTTSLVTGRPKNLSVEYDTDEIDDIPVGLTDFTGGQVNARPFVVCNPQRSTGAASDGTPLFIDASCFSRPNARGDIGNTTRNSLRRPGVFNADLALFKNIRLGEKVNIQFRWETYNIFNHANFSDIDAELNFNVDASGRVDQTNNLLGRPIDARSPRVMQGSLRLSF